jgi:quinol monooxygenase YgiN
MTASLIVVAVGAVAAAVGTGVLTGRCSRTPRAFLVAWTVAIFALAVALAAQALGYLAGFSDPIFRATEIGAQAIAPLALCLGLVELIARSVPARFAMRLAVSAIGVIVLVILGTDPLSPNVTLTTAWPDPAAVYQLVPVGLIKFLAVFTLVTALASCLVALARSGRGRPFQDVVRPALVGAAAAVAVALPGVAMLAGASLGSAGSALAYLLAAVLIWLGGMSAVRRVVADDRRGLADDRRAGVRDRSYPVNEGWGPDGRHRYDDDDLDRAHPGSGSGYREGPGYDAAAAGSGRRLGDPDADLSYPALAALAAESPEPSDEAGRYGQSGRYGQAARDHPGWPDDSGQPDSVRHESRDHDPDALGPGQFGSGQFDSGQFDDSVLFGPATGALDAHGPGAPGGRGAQAADAAMSQARLFGQITIYTLIEDRLAEFDRLTEQVVEQVRAKEPGTLVYIVHAVPTAPMQRILYEVYQDRPAYDEHLSQPYMMRYVAERRSMVLATNAIELGLQQAKMSPLPTYSAISDLLSESGIDLTGVTRSSRGVAAGTGGRYGRTAPAEVPAPDGPGYPPAEADEHGYDHWADLRGEDPRYR